MRGRRLDVRLAHHKHYDRKEIRKTCKHIEYSITPPHFRANKKF